MKEFILQNILEIAVQKLFFMFHACRAMKNLTLYESSTTSISDEIRHIL